MGDLQVEQDLRFEKREWQGQLIGRLVMLAIALGALLGFFGAGPLSLTEEQDVTGDLNVIYEHYGRRGATTNLTVAIHPNAFSDGEAEVWLSSDYLGQMQVDAITPSPDQVTAQEDGFVYTFLVDQPEDPITVTYNFTIDAMGSVAGEIGLPDAAPIELDHFFTP